MAGPLPSGPSGSSELLVPPGPSVLPLGPSSMLLQAPALAGGSPLSDFEFSSEWGPRSGGLSLAAGEAQSLGSGSGGSPALGLRFIRALDNIKQRFKEAGDFPPLRVNLWRRGASGSLLEEGLRSGLDPIEAVIGSYVITFDTGELDRSFASDDPIEIEAGGKRAIIERVRQYADGRLVLKVQLAQNPIPLLILIGAAAAGIGLGGFGLASALSSVDRVVVDTSDQIVKLGILGAVGFVGYVAVRKWVL